MLGDREAIFILPAWQRATSGRALWQWYAKHSRILSRVCQLVTTAGSLLPHACSGSPHQGTPLSPPALKAAKRP